jgi:hypothetical protein
MVICASAISTRLVAVKRLRLKLHHATAALENNDRVQAATRGGAI